MVSTEPAQPADFSTNPAFVTAFPTLPLSFDGVDVELEDVEITGVFSASGDPISGVELRGRLDATQLSDLAGTDGCTWLATFGIACGPCPGGGSTCLDVVVDSMDALEVPGLVLQQRGATQIANDPACP